MNINWESNSRESNESCNFRLARMRNGYLSFKPTISYIFIGMLFLTAGVGVLWLLKFGEPVTKSTFGIALGYFLAVGFCLAGIGPFVFMFEEVSFNAMSQKIKIDRRFTYAGERICLKFSEVDSIQLLEKLVKERDGEHRCYELNLILVNRVRKTLIVHGNNKIILEDARMLSRLLKKELHSNVV